MFFMERGTIMAQKMSLAKSVQNKWASNHKQGVELLQLLDQSIENVKVNRDWDALAWFLSGATKSGQDAIVKYAIRAAFGERLKLDAARGKVHQSGCAFKLMWNEGDKIEFGNHYGLLKQAMEEGKSLFDQGLKKAFHTIFRPEPVKPELDKKVETIAKAIAKATSDFNIGEDLLEQKIVNRVKALIAEAKAKNKA